MVENVYSTGLVQVEENNSWRVGPHTNEGVVTVTLDLDTITEDKYSDYLTGVGNDVDTVWIKSGLPLAKITESGEYGPYDPEASDGRQLGIAGLLESNVQLDVKLSGLRPHDGSSNVGMRYRGDIRVKQLPYDVSGAKWGGDFYDVDEDTVTPLSAAGTESGSSVSAATTSTAGVVKVAAAVTDPSDDTGDHAALTSLLANLRAAGILAAS